MCFGHRGGSRAGLWGGLNCPFQVKSFLTLLFAIGNIAALGVMAPRLSSGSASVWISKRKTLFTLSILSTVEYAVCPNKLSQCVLKMQATLINTLLNKEFYGESYSPCILTPHSKLLQKFELFGCPLQMPLPTVQASAAGTLRHLTAIWKLGLNCQFLLF